MALVLSPRIAVLFLGVSALASALITPVEVLAQEEKSGSAVRAVQRQHLSIDIGACPQAKQESPDAKGMERSLVAPDPTAVATSLATVAAGAAIESAVNYLTQERVFTSRGVAVLTPDNHQDLFANRKCLYAYLYTLDLWRYFNPGQQHPPASGASPLAIAPQPLASASGPVLSDPAVIRDISAKKLTDFMMIVSFEPAGVKNVTTGKENEGQVTHSFYRPYFWATIYPNFVDRTCIAFRNCAKRDVMLQLVLRFPTAPDPSKTATRAFAFSKAYEGSRSSAVGAALTQRHGQWFAVNINEPILTNLELTLVESSKPGAFTRALGASLKEEKSSVIKVVLPQE